MNNTEFNQFLALETWISFFQNHQKLPKNKITCSKCKVNTTSMLASSNLKNSLPKFGNDIRRLLTEFVCRDCRTINAPKKAAQVPITTKDNEEGIPRAKKGSKLVVETPEEREERIEEIRANLPKMNLTGPTMEYSLNNPDHVKVLTTTSCWYPNIYLDGGKWCNACPIFKDCCCSLKRRKN